MSRPKELTLPEKINVMQSFAAGKAVQVYINGECVDDVSPPWDWGAVCYRVKPDPLIAWANVYDSGLFYLYTTRSEADEFRTVDGRLVKLQEVDHGSV